MEALGRVELPTNGLGMRRSALFSITYLSQGRINTARNSTPIAGCVLSRKLMSDKCRTACQRGEPSDDFVVSLWVRFAQEDLPAALAAQMIRIDPPDVGRPVNVATMRTDPGRDRREQLIAGARHQENPVYYSPPALKALGLGFNSAARLLRCASSNRAAELFDLLGRFGEVSLWPASMRSTSENSGSSMNADSSAMTFGAPKPTSCASGAWS